MNVQMFRHCMTSIESAFSREYSKDLKNLLWEELKAEPDKAMEEAGNWLVMNCTSLPPAGKVRERVQEEGKKIRLSEAKQRDESWQKEKESEKAFSIHDLAARTEYEHRCLDILKVVSLPEGAPAGFLVEASRHMANVYPGTDWGILGAKLEQKERRMTA